MQEEIRPLGGRVLARLVAEESVTKSGLVIPGTAKVEAAARRGRRRRR
jgi:co-chaperonin GroES (HSP10)